MSGPQAQAQQQAQPPDDLSALLVVQAATLLTLEAGSAYAATYSLRGALEALRRLANRRWMLAGGSPVGVAPISTHQREHIVQELVLELRRIAAGVERDVPPILRQEAERALELGAQHAAQQIGEVVDAAELVLDETARRVIDATPRSAVSHLLKAAEQIERAQTGMDLQTALAEAERSVASVNTGSTYATNHAANDAARQVAVRRGEKLLWIAERDACVVCLALSGDVVDPNEGEGFDELATFGPYAPPEVWPFGMPLMHPPRHPHCRCQTCVWLGSLAGQPDFPERLKHEAARSVLKGWSLPSESNTVRLKAAEKLLHRGGRGLPKSVQEEAARAVARGKFQSRTVPHKPRTTTKEHTHV
jgi:hypothetical protein